MLARRARAVLRKGLQDLGQAGNVCIIPVDTRFGTLLSGVRAWFDIVTIYCSLLSSQN